MIEWQSNFNIPESSIQTDKVCIRILSFKLLDSTTEVVLEFIDGNGIILSTYTNTIMQLCTTESEIYNVLLSEYTPSYLI